MLTFSGNIAGFWRITAPSLWTCGRWSYSGQTSVTLGRQRTPPCQSSCSWGISTGASHGHHAEDAGDYGAAHHADGWAAEDHLATAGTDISSTVTCTRVCPIQMPGSTRPGQGTLACFYCGKPGHYNRDCRKHQSDFARRIQSSQMPTQQAQPAPAPQAPSQQSGAAEGQGFQ